MNGVGDEWKSSERKLDAKWNTIFARGCKAAGFNVLSATKYGWHEVTQIRWMAFQNGRTRAGVMPPRTDRPLDIAPLHSIPPPPPSPFALFHAFSRSFFFLSRFPFLSSPFPSNVFSSLSLSVTQVWSRDNFGWQKTKRGRMAVTRETRSMRHFAVKVARFSMEMLVLTYSRGERDVFRIIGLSIISKENFLQTSR